MKRRWLMALMAIAGLAQGAEAACRQALALALDVSGSVDAQEYRLQVDGLAMALGDAAVQEALLQFPQAPVRLMVFEWSGFHYQRILINWQEIAGPPDIARVITALRQTQAGRIDDPSTAIGPAMLFGANALGTQHDCWQRTLDISGDGPANFGPHPRDLTGAALAGITVNALVIGPDSRANTTKNLKNVKTLEAYFRSFVIRGPGAFAETARDYADFADAMRRKLIRELDAPVLSRRGPLPRLQ